MVHLKNIQQHGNLVTFDGYINGDPARHFTMTVNLNDSSKSTASIPKCYHTSEALLKIFFAYAENKKLPSELVAMTH